MARASRAGKQTAARERARLARQQVDAKRAVRDRKIEEAAAAFFVAQDEHNTVAKQLVGIEEKMASAIGELLDLRETGPRIAALLGIDSREVRRLRTEQKKKEETAITADGSDDS